jgi:hypothetical protein
MINYFGVIYNTVSTNSITIRHTQPGKANVTTIKPLSWEVDRLR